jgi:hypothetical protein
VVDPIWEILDCVCQLFFFFNGFTEMKVERLAINGKVLIMAGRE